MLRKREPKFEAPLRTSRPRLPVIRLSVIYSDAGTFWPIRSHSAWICAFFSR